MSSSTPTNTSKLDRILADNQRDKEMGYRDKALKNVSARVRPLRP